MADQLGDLVAECSISAAASETITPKRKATLTTSEATPSKSVRLLDELTAAAAKRPVQDPTMRVRAGDGYGSILVL